jgi:hypothetical protein
MKRVVAGLFVVLLAGVGAAQERIPDEEARKYSMLLVGLTAKVPDLQLQLEPDAAKPHGMKHENVGAMVIPAKSLSEKAVQNAGKDVIPLGQFWLRNLTVLFKDQPVASEKLRMVKVTIDDQDHLLPLFMLGVRKKADSTLELVVYAKDKEPLLTVPLKKVESKQELPIELEGKAENDRGTLTFNILGKYQCQLSLAKQEP